jgi:hypothetical protein
VPTALPGFHFDLTAPTISGALDKRVSITRRAKSARVTFSIAARDDVDGVAGNLFATVWESLRGRKHARYLLRDGCQWQRERRRLRCHGEAQTVEGESAAITAEAG